MANTKKGGLGRGLGALISPAGNVEAATPPARTQEAVENDAPSLLMLNPRELRPNPQQPRQYFDEENLQELAESIRNDGLQEPIIVREQEGAYQLVSGERRVRASILAELESVPAVCYDVSDEDMLKLGLIENIQREDLNAIELARAYRKLTDDFDWTQDELAAKVGKKRATVSNAMRLLHLPEDVQESVIDGSISMGHARALLALESPTEQSSVARRIVRDGLSVRDVEGMHTKPKRRAAKAAPEKNPHLETIEDDLRRKLGTKINVRANSDWKGKIEIEFYDLNDLERILDVIRS